MFSLTSFLPTRKTWQYGRSIFRVKARFGTFSREIYNVFLNLKVAYVAKMQKSNPAKRLLP